MITIVDANESLKNELVKTFGEYDAVIKSKKHIGDNIVYTISLSDRFYTYNITSHTEFISVTRVPMAGDTADSNMATLSWDVNDMWRLEVF